MGMSYKRAWMLVEALNSQFRAPLVKASKGGEHGGGAELTALGVEVLDRYRQMEKRVAKVLAADIKVLQASVISKRK